MKKVIVICIALVCVIGLVAIFIWNSNKPQDITLIGMKDMTEEQIENKLMGKDINDITKLFGEPDASLSGMYGIIYDIVKGEKNIIIYFDGDNKVNNVLLRLVDENVVPTVEKKFEIGVLVSNKPEVVKVLNNKDINENNEDYNLYYYGFAELNIMLGEDDVLPLKDALLNGSITFDEIIEKANKDVLKTQEQYAQFEEYQSVPKLFPYSETYKDGGSVMYYYETYNILKCNTLDGNKDIYIGIPQMKINDVLK